MHDILDFLTLSRQQDASDLHIAAGAPPMLRIHGQLTPLDVEPLDATMCRGLIMGVLTDSQRSRLEKDWDLDFALHVEGVGRFRGNAHHARGSVEAAFRYIPVQPPDLASLGHSESVEELCNVPHGLILVTGVAGMGKSTTLAAMTRRIIEERAGVVVTVEDPVEYVFEHGRSIVKQRQIGTDTPSFSLALRSAMRQDLNVIVVSEMRDLDSISAAITAAETGHLVISTLHTRDAPGAVDRMVDVFPPQQQAQVRTQLASVLTAVVSQRLMPRADVPGRVMASEVMIVNQGIRSAIHDHRFEQIYGLMQIGASQGMHTFDDSYLHLACNGHIHLDEALRYARHPEDLQINFREHLRTQKRRQ